MKFAVLCILLIAVIATASAAGHHGKRSHKRHLQKRCHGGVHTCKICPDKCYDGCIFKVPKCPSGPPVEDPHHYDVICCECKCPNDNPAEDTPPVEIDPTEPPTEEVTDAPGPESESEQEPEEGPEPGEEARKRHGRRTNRH